jgi:hypothetical protein
MSTLTRTSSAPWTIVVADDHGYESALPPSADGQVTPVQYGRLNGRRPLFQEALRRALQIAPVSQVLVTTQEAYRVHWESALWFIRPEHRFVSTQPGMSWLTTAAAILAIAYKAPDSIVTLLPGRCFVSHESILTEAIDRAVALLPTVPEGVISLGMQDLEDGIDEDYLVPPKGQREFLQPLLGVARRPLPWIAQYLRAEGALVASRVTCSYARTLAAHICLVWPGLASRLVEHVLSAAGQPGDGGVRISIPNGLPKAILRSRLWYPPALPQRALRVTGCGWSALRTARAAARVTSFLCPDLPASLGASQRRQPTAPVRSPGSA